MEITATLPRFCIVRSNYNNKYLQLHTTWDVPNIAIQFGGSNIDDISAIFEMLPASKGGGLYNIRSMLNNKYLSHLGDGHMWITAISAYPVEDQRSRMCTLFKPVLVNPRSDNKTIRLRHVKTGRYACLWRVGPPFNDCLYTATSSADQDGCDVYTIINWKERHDFLGEMEATATLPRFCIIRSNYNNKYLRLHTTSDVPNIAIQFGGSNIFDISARFEMVPATTGGGLYNIRSMHNKKYMSHLGDGHMWITAISAKPVEDQHSKMCTLFKPVLVNPRGDNKTIRLRHVKTGRYACLWRVGPPFNDCLYTATSAADEDGCDVYTIINSGDRLADLPADISDLECTDKNAWKERVAVLEADVGTFKGSNIGSHAGSNISGFNGAGGNNNKYQSNDNNHMKHNEFIKIEAFNFYNRSNISS